MFHRTIIYQWAIFPNHPCVIGEISLFQTEISRRHRQVLGIDLGTTNSVMAAVEAAVPTVLPNSEAEQMAGFPGKNRRQRRETHRENHGKNRGESMGKPWENRPKTGIEP